MANLLHVAVGVIKNSEGQVLLSKRRDDAHQGGLWEFPGGKVELGETTEQALQRELKEELGIQVTRSKPLIKINHHYRELSVCLDVRLVENHAGSAASLEGQPISWVMPNDLAQYDFPAANLPIITALKLPRCYAILEGENHEVLASNLQTVLNKDIRLIQLRAKTLSDVEFRLFAKTAVPMINSNKSSVLLNTSPELGIELDADGIHLSSQRLLMLDKRPLPKQMWVAASCHNLRELRHAEKIDVDFAVLGPVFSTPSHPQLPAMGWDTFNQLVTEAKIPVYALGGLSEKDIELSVTYGAQGIAGISAFIT